MSLPSNFLPSCVLTKNFPTFNVSSSDFLMLFFFSFYFQLKTYCWQTFYYCIDECRWKFSALFLLWYWIFYVRFFATELFALGFFLYCRVNDCVRTFIAVANCCFTERSERSQYNCFKSQCSSQEHHMKKYYVRYALMSGW